MTPGQKYMMDMDPMTVPWGLSGPVPTIREHDVSQVQPLLCFTSSLESHTYLVFSDPN